MTQAEILALEDLTLPAFVFSFDSQLRSLALYERYTSEEKYRFKVVGEVYNDGRTLGMLFDV